MKDVQDPEVVPVRSMFLSDLHLGFRHSRVTELLDFLTRHEPENLYLVGDFIDGWCLQKQWHWPLECNLVVARLMDLARRGTRIRFAIGNHDAFLRDPLIQRLIVQSGSGEVAEEFEHRTADGRMFLVLHGDQFDHYERASVLTTRCLSLLYEATLRMNSAWSHLTSAAMHGRYSLFTRLKQRIQSLGRHVHLFRSLVVRHARVRGAHGVICGHVHSPQKEDIDGFIYYNAGDWVENCTALIEDHEGSLHLVWPGDAAAQRVRNSSGTANESAGGMQNAGPEMSDRPNVFRRESLEVAAMFSQDL